MTRIDFYVTKANGALARERLACRIAEKAFRLGHRLHIHAADEAAVSMLDELLWTFRDTSFLPHARLGSEIEAPITLGHRDTPAPPLEVLINLAPEIPPFFSRFSRVAEIVSGEAGAREQGRAHFRFYRDRGYPLHHHDL